MPWTVDQLSPSQLQACYPLLLTVMLFGIFHHYGLLPPICPAPSIQYDHSPIQSVRLPGTLSANGNILYALYYICVPQWFRQFGRSIKCIVRTSSFHAEP
ncbi:hypothetical protein PLICRDRAFT_52965 [Plicaturopsis crispa FD-325 SS-3]|nr:hypothetical protein PLICRDRAFT_52965 [Plicaturopsis crispa FD-325 SS-3]